MTLTQGPAQPLFGSGEASEPALQGGTVRFQRKHVLWEEEGAQLNELTVTFSPLT